MPFVIRKVEPRYVCRGHVPQGSAAQGLPVGAELEAVANGALTASLKQLASLITTAEDIFAELTAEVTSLADRSGLLRDRLQRVQRKLDTVDPKKITVRKYDLTSREVKVLGLLSSSASFWTNKFNDVSFVVRNFLRIFENRCLYWTTFHTKKSQKGGQKKEWNFKEVPRLVYLNFKLRRWY